MKHRYLMLLLISALACSVSTGAQSFVDPTRPVAAQAKEHSTGSALRVTAILRSGTRRIAIIDGKALAEGDSIGNARVESIGSDAVQFIRAGRRETVRLATEVLQVRQTDLH